MRTKSRGKYWTPASTSETLFSEENGVKTIQRKFFRVGVKAHLRGETLQYEEIVVIIENSFGTVRKNADNEVTLSAHHKYGRKACWKSDKGRLPASLQADKRILPTLFALMQRLWAGEELYCMPTDKRRDRVYVKALKRVGADISEHSEYVIRFKF